MQLYLRIFGFFYNILIGLSESSHHKNSENSKITVLANILFYIPETFQNDTNVVCRFSLPVVVTFSNGSSLLPGY